MGVDYLHVLVLESMVQAEGLEAKSSSSYKKKISFLGAEKLTDPHLDIGDYGANKWLFNVLATFEA